MIAISLHIFLVRPNKKPDSKLPRLTSDSGEIRTHDRSLRRRMLYPAELPNQQQ